MTSTIIIVALIVVCAALLAVIWRERRARIGASMASPEQNAGAANAVISGAVDAIITSSNEGRIESFNRAAERMFGYQQSDVVGRNLKILMRSPHREKHDDYLRAYRETGVAKIIGIGREVECLRRDGSVFWGDLAVSTNDHGDAPGYTGVIRDLTSRKTVEKTLANTVRRLNLALGAGGLVAWEYRSDLQEFFYNRPRPNIEEQTLAPERLGFEAAMERVDEADRDRVMAQFAEDSTQDCIREFEYRIADRDGRTRWIRNHLISINDTQSNERSWIGICRDITRSRRAENRATSLGRILDESRNEIYVFAADTLRFKMVNRCALENLGYDNDEISVMTPVDLKKDIPHDEFIRLLRPLVDGSAALVNITTRHFRKDGNTYPVDVHIVRGALDEQAVYFAIALDLTDQEHFLRKLRRTEEEHRLTVDYAPLGISTMNKNGRIEAINRAGLRMTGYKESDLTGRRGLAFIHADDRAATVIAFDRLTSGELPHTVVPHRLRTHDNNYIYVQTHYAVVHSSHGQPDTIIAMHQDLTDQQAREKEIENHREKLAHVSRLGTMGQMAAGLAHEINQPLAAIATYAQACQRLLGQGDVDREDLEHALDQVSQQAHRAGDVIRRMRSLARGKHSVRESCHIRQLIYELMPLINTDARHANVEMRLDVPAELPTIYADPVQIQQVLLNLIRNGVDAMRELSTHERTLNIGTRLRDGDNIRVTVTDQGAGVAANAADQLFDPFFTTKKSGMGMGLSISRSIIKAHGGQIGYEPNPDGGSMFWFSVPTEGLKERVDE